MNDIKFRSSVLIIERKLFENSNSQSRGGVKDIIGLYSFNGEKRLSNRKSFTNNKNVKLIKVIK